MIKQSMLTRLIVEGDSGYGHLDQVHIRTRVDENGDLEEIFVRFTYEDSTIEPLVLYASSVVLTLGDCLEDTYEEILKALYWYSFYPISVMRNEPTVFTQKFLNYERYPMEEFDPVFTQGSVSEQAVEKLVRNMAENPIYYTRRKEMTFTDETVLFAHTADLTEYSINERILFSVVVNIFDIKYLKPVP